MVNLKKDFPIFKTNPGLVYLDSAATSQKPKQVIEAVSDWYCRYNSNVHRGMYDLSEKATQVYESVRVEVAKFINAESSDEIIFTGNATEAINLAAWGWGRKQLKRGDVVVLSEMEHHSNIVPWIRLKKECGIKLFYLPINNKWEADYQKISELPKNKIKLIALAGASNVLGTINPVSELVNWLISKKIKAKVLVDGAQLVPHMPVDVKELGCDFLAFSSHKMLGPSGLGILWGKRKLLEQMEPLAVGSHMITEVTKDRAIWAELPDRFETGTGRMEAVAGLGAAVGYFDTIGWKRIKRIEQELTEYALNKINKISDIEIYGKNSVKDRLGVISFNINGVHAHDVAEILNRRQICVRAGHHCAQPLMKVLGVPATVRISLYIYNDRKDIDKLIEGIGEIKRIFKK